MGSVATFQIFVKTLTGKTISLRYASTLLCVSNQSPSVGNWDTIEVIKQKIQDKEVGCSIGSMVV